VSSSLLYWNGSGEVSFSAPPEGTYLNFWLHSSYVTLDGESGAQSAQFVETVAKYGSVHTHGVSALYAQSGHSNVPGESGYLAPADGVYAFSIVLTLTNGATTYTSDTLWIVFNSNVPETAFNSALNFVDAVMVPEPAGAGLLLAGACTLLARRRKRRAY